MPTFQKITRLGIIAGSGDLPHALAQACLAQGIDVFIVALDGHCGAVDPSIPHMRAKIGKSGRIIKALQEAGIKDIVLIGAIKRPRWGELVPDLKTLEFIVRYGFFAKGDDDLLKKLRSFLEGQGLALHGVHRFMQDLLAPEGVLGSVQPNKGQQADIVLGFSASQELGARDIGQAVVVQDGKVLGVECAEGTDALIRRCGALQKGPGGAILVKSCKPQQDMDLDLPTVGINTLKAAYSAGFSGIVVHAGRTLLLDQDAVLQFADAHNMFVVGFDG